MCECVCVCVCVRASVCVCVCIYMSSPFVSLCVCMYMSSPFVYIPLRGGVYTDSLSQVRELVLDMNRKRFRQRFRQTRGLVSALYKRLTKGLV